MTFCSSCGNKLDDSNVFCPACGMKVKAPESQNPVTKTVNGKERLPLLTFRDFKATKEKERAMHFRPSRNSRDKSKRKLISNENLDESVNINVGIMLYDGQQLKCQRGKSLLVTLKKSAQAVDLLNVSLNKHKAHSKNLIKPNAKYVILYPDGSKVVKLKETDDDFVLHKYKMECNKPYHRITFFLCPEVDFSMASLQQCLFDESSDDDMSKQELIDEESVPKSRKLNDKDNVTIEVDNTSTARACQILSSDSYTDSKDKLFISTGMSSIDADGKAYCSQSCGNSHQLNYGTLCEMFPQVGDSEIEEALGNASGNIEVAVSHILDTTSLQTSLHTTPQQVYASLEFCNDIDSDDDFKDLSNTADSVVEHKTEVGTNNEEPIADVIRRFVEEKLKKDCTFRVKVI